MSNKAYNTEGSWLPQEKTWQEKFPKFWTKKFYLDRLPMIINLGPLVLLIFIMIFGNKYLDGSVIFLLMLLIYILPLFLFPIIEKISFPLAVFGETLFKFRILDASGALNLEHHAMIKLPYALIRGDSVNPDHQVIEHRLVSAIDPIIRKDLIDVLDVARSNDNIFHLTFSPPYEFINEEGSLELFDSLFVKAPGHVQTIDELFQKSPYEIFVFSASVRGYATGYVSSLKVIDTYRGIPICVNLLTLDKVPVIEPMDKFRIDEYIASYWRNKCAGLKQELEEERYVRKEVLQRGIAIAQMEEHLRRLMHADVPTGQQKASAILMIIGALVVGVYLGAAHVVNPPFIDNNNGAQEAAFILIHMLTSMIQYVILLM